MRKERTDLQRFQIGDVVRVTTAIMSQRSRQVGTIVSVQVSPHAKTLDKYIVFFSDDRRERFWDIQLEPVTAVHPMEEASSAAHSHR